MEHLSSCYFCGAALDERLQEYPVVPESIREGEDVTTATLCPACHQKLETILDAVVEANSASLAAVDNELGETASGTGNSDSHTGDGTETTNDSTVSTGDDMWESAAADVASESADDDTRSERSTGEGESLVDDATGDDDPVTADDVAALAGDIDADILDGDEGADDDAGEGAELESAMDADVPDEFDTADGSEEETDSDTNDVTAEDVDAQAGDIDADILDEGGEDTADADDADEETGLQSAMEPDVPDELQATGNEAGDAEPAEHESDGSGGQSETNGNPVAESSDSGTGTAAEPEPATDPEPARTSVSALEYNKVMRLLQNREFPVDRDEIETVAANAYGLARSECAEVIDLAVDRGLIGEDGDQLVRSD